MASGSPKRGVKWFAVLLVVAAAGFAAWWFTGDARKAPEPLNTVEVTRGDIQLLVSATGVLEPSNYVGVPRCRASWRPSMFVSARTSRKGTCWRRLILPSTPPR